MAENTFKMKGRNADEYFKNVYLAVLKEIKKTLDGNPCENCPSLNKCPTPIGCPGDRILKVRELVTKTLKEA